MTPFIVITVCCGLAGGIVGRLKGSSFLLWFLIAAIPPYIGIIAAVLYRYEQNELRRQCPECGKVVKLYEALCTRCGAELQFPEVAIAPEAAAAAREPVAR